jgi:hypothetical protein
VLLKLPTQNKIKWPFIRIPHVALLPTNLHQQELQLPAPHELMAQLLRWLHFGGPTQRLHQRRPVIDLFLDQKK